jgi:hypothetical protein
MSVEENSPALKIQSAVARTGVDEQAFTPCPIWAMTERRASM